MKDWVEKARLQLENNLTSANWSRYLYALCVTAMALYKKNPVMSAPSPVHDGPHDTMFATAG